MKYINGYDLPFEVQMTLAQAIERREPLRLTTPNGEMIILPIEQYREIENLNNSYTRDDDYSLRRESVGADDLEFMNRDEIDY